MTKERLSGMSLVTFMTQYQTYVNKILMKGSDPIILDKYREFINNE